MKVLIVGYGSIGKKYFQIFKNFGCETKIFDKKNSLKKKNIFFFKTFQEAKGWKPEIVIICNNSNQHIDTLYSLLSKNVKSYLIEKPLDIYFKKINKLKKLSLSYQNKIFVVNNINFFDPIKLIKKELPNIGKVNYSNIFFGHNLLEMRKKISKNHYIKKKRTSGGVILDCIHEIFYSIYLFGLVKKIKIDKFKLTKLTTDYEDLAKLTLVHTNKVISFISLDFIQYIKNRGCEIYGTKGSIIWRLLGKKNIKSSLTVIKKNNYGKEKYLIKNFNFDPEKQYIEMIKELLNYSRKNKQKNLISLRKYLNLNSRLKKIYLD